MHTIDPVTAACHDNPYPYYLDLQRGPALAWHAPLNLWVASRAAVIREVLEHPLCMVRPPAQPVPAALRGSPVGLVFSNLVRMNDGVRHGPLKAVLRQALAGVDLAALKTSSGQLATLLATRHARHGSLALTPWMFELPTWAVGELLGVERALLPQLGRQVADLVRALAPTAGDQERRAGDVAAQALLVSFHQLPDAPASLIRSIRQGAARSNCDDAEALACNLIGLLTQTHEATAGLIGNSVVALSAQPDPSAIKDAGALVREVCRLDAPVQNTRRFLAEASTIAGIDLPACATILLLLGAAGRDPQAACQAHDTAPAFGHGRHACPGQQLALTIATAALETLLAMPLPPSPGMAAPGYRYRTSANGRLPEFDPVPYLSAQEPT